LCLDGVFLSVFFECTCGRVTSQGIGELILSSISKCDIHTRGELQRSIICSGGTTAMEGGLLCVAHSPFGFLGSPRVCLSVRMLMVMVRAVCVCVGGGTQGLVHG